MSRKLYGSGSLLLFTNTALEGAHTQKKNGAKVALHLRTMFPPIVSCYPRACFNKAEAAKPGLEPGDLALQPLALFETNLQNLLTPFRLPKTIQMKDLVDV